MLKSPGFISLSILSTLLLTVCSFTQASAATLGYWRFEGNSTEFLEDSSGIGNDIAAGMTAGSNQVSIPALNNASDFPSTIPQTYANNQFTSVSGKGSIPYNASFTSTAFTVEAFVSADTLTSAYQMFAAQWDTGGNQRRWAFGTQNGGQRLALLLNTTGASGGNAPVNAPTSAFDLSVDTDYYLAVSYDGSSTTLGNNGITFYLKNLTTDGPLLSASVDNTVNIFNSNADLSIGGILGASSLDWNGWIDEVRYSSGIVLENDLLINLGPTPPSAAVPEPSSFVLLTLSMSFLVLRRRSKSIEINQE